MTDPTQDLLARVLALPEADRRVIADALDASLIDPDGPWADPEFRAEIERRSDAVHDGTAELIPWDVAMAEVRAEFEARRAAGDRDRAVTLVRTLGWAQLDVLEAGEWYEARQAGLAARFFAAVADAGIRIGRLPLAYPRVASGDGEKSARGC